MFKQNINELKQYVSQLAVGEGEQLMILAADKSASDVDEIRSFLNSEGIKFFGGIFAGLLVGGKQMNRGFIIKKVKPLFCSLVLPFMLRMKSDPSTFAGCTAIMLVDGLSARMKDLTDTAYDKLGDHVKYAGGGAGFYDLSHKPCIFDNQGTYMDVMYMCIIEAEARLAVRHGWNKLVGPFYVTKSEDNILKELDNENAYELYRHIIEQEERITLFKEDFFMFAKDHPFGIELDDGSLLVRDPVTVNDNDEIVCVANIPQNVDLYILKGNTDTLLSSSMQIAQYCAEDAPEKYTPLLFDCISRSMFMEDRFEEELVNIQAMLGFPVEGTLSIGEIASKKNGGLVIHNKSIILVLLAEKDEPVIV